MLRTGLGEKNVVSWVPQHVRLVIVKSRQTRDGRVVANPPVPDVA